MVICISRLPNQEVSASGHIWPQRCKAQCELAVRWKLKYPLADQEQAQRFSRFLGLNLNIYSTSKVPSCSKHPQTLDKKTLLDFTYFIRMRGKT